jgi:uncharacterized membrane protein YbhN (UPF0104 family)
MTSVTARPTTAPSRPRVSPRGRWALTALVLGGVVGVSAVELRTVDWAVVLAGLRWWLVGAAALASGLSIAGAAWNLIGFSPVRLPLGNAVLAQLAGTALKVVTPASVGTVAVNARLVHRSGASTPRAVLAVAGSQVAQFAVTLLVVAAVVVVGGRDAAPVQPHVPGALVASVGVVVLLTLLTRRWWWRLVPVTATARLAEVRPQLLAVLRTPRRCVAGIGGCVLLTTGLAAALWACVEAVGGHLTMLPLLVVLLGASALGATVPTPGGVGGVEAALTGGLVAAGLPLAQAVPAVVLYRALTFWLVVPVGTLAAAELRRRDLL